MLQFLIFVNCLKRTNLNEKEAVDVPLKHSRLETNTLKLQILAFRLIGY